MAAEGVAFSYKAVFVAVVVAALYGIFPSAMHIAYVDGANAAFTVFATTWARAAALILCCLIKGKPLFQSREDIRQAMIGGFFQAASATFVFLALTMLSGPIVIMVLFSHTLMLLVLIIVKKDIRMSVSVMAITGSALFGLGLVLDVDGAKTPENYWGILLSFLAAAAIVVCMYVYGKQTRERYPAVVGAENFLVAALLVTVLALVSPVTPPHSLSGFVWTAVGCVTMGLATLMMFFGIAMVGAFGWSLFSKTEPIFTAIFAAVLAHDILKPSQYIGMFVVLGSLAAYQVLAKRNEKNA